MTAMNEMNTVADTPVFPKLLASSKDAGWEGLTVWACHEPYQMEEWLDPGTLDTSLVLIARGSLRLEQRPVNGSWTEHYLSSGHLLLKPGEKMPTEVRWTSCSSEPIHLLRILLSREILTQTAEELTDRDAAQLCLTGRLGFQDPLLTQIGLALWRELEQDAPAGKLYAEAAARVLAVHLVRHYASLSPAIREPSQGLTYHQLNQLVDFILAHLSENLSLEILAGQVGFSAYHFARLFREATGESPHQFVLRQRIERAKQLLRETDMPIAAIAVESGFANQGHLTQAFKRYLNLTPRLYRHTSLTLRTFLVK